MEGSMHRGESLVADLESPRLSDPSQAPLHHVADLTQAAAVWGPLPRQVVATMRAGDRRPLSSVS